MVRAETASMPSYGTVESATRRETREGFSLRLVVRAFLVVPPVCPPSRCGAAVSLHAMNGYVQSVGCTRKTQARAGMWQMRALFISNAGFAPLSAAGKHVFALPFPAPHFSDCLSRHPLRVLSMSLPSVPLARLLDRT